MVLLALVLVACGTARLPRAARGPEGSWRTFANGLRLYVAPDASGDLVRVHMRVRAGSRNEGRAEAGLAHFSEHVAFARTLADGRTVLAALGEEALAYGGTTGADSVDFMATTVAAHLPTVLELFASALDGSCEVRPEVFARERNVVLSEIETRTRGSVGAYDRLLASIYSPDHPYGHVLGGTPETVSALTAKDVCDYLRGRFTPGNTSIAITGGVTEARALAAAEATLKPLAKRTTLPEVAVPPVAVVGGRETLAGLPGGWGSALVLHLPPADSEDGRLAAILAEAVEREVRELVGAYGQISGLEVHRLGGSAAPAMIFIATGGVQAEVRAFAEEILAQAVANVRGDAADKQKVEALRRRLRIAAATRFERLDARAERLVEVADGSRRGTLATDLRAIDGLTPAALTRVAEQVLAPGRTRVFALEPSTARAGSGVTAVTRLTDDAHPVTARPDVAARLLSEIPATRRNSSFTLANGLTVVLAPSSSPLVDVRLVIQAGAVDAPEHPLLPALAAALVAPPKQGPHAKAVAKMTAGGAETDVFINLDLTIFKARGLASEAEHLLRGLAAWVIAGDYDFAERAAKVDGIYREIEKQRAAESTRRQLARGVLDQCVEPLFLDRTLDELSDAAIAAFRQQHFRAGRATLIVAGGFDEAAARARVEAAFGGRQGPWGERAAPPARPSRPAPRVTSKVLHLETPTTNAQIGVLLGFVVPSELRGEPGTVSLVRQLLEDAVDGVRQRLGVTYGLSVTRDELCDAEMVLIGGEIDAVHLDQGIAELRQTLARLRTAEGVAAGLAAAQRPVAARILAGAADSDTIAERLVYIVAHGLPLDYYRGEARDVVLARADAVAELMTRLLAPGSLFAVCIGESTASCESLSSL
ncbi:insulinase family protein [Nannocystis sp. ILAH1]|uniref:M16 family metallopeptidase n=1 Tax=Nannocystis sp. ILAH1 TaxID=2996789 RepID=UPI00226FD787|nr:M16 family metallopeptidase [Nannocystis sp. ILAH1]MCY0986671.1 insulinase family protein [Nannocystis sp. ILAH1]